ncbi:adenylosuccinate lyase [Lentibacter algarum]|uniref:adenylosuccinate lyase n=1 Tax=Lentibacter algarum TaxID=576131 RepID=UPI001C07E641|nr:adenylosuccinate lyase [Lentibacter algarum]MBU2980824.1 adenylosuccinate lyase [Lentibacter algarum]
MTKFILTTAFICSASVGSAMCNKGHDAAMSCAAGSTYDSATGTCTPIINS